MLHMESKWSPQAMKMACGYEGASHIAQLFDLTLTLRSYSSSIWYNLRSVSKDFTTPATSIPNPFQALVNRKEWFECLGSLEHGRCDGGWVTGQLGSMLSNALPNRTEVLECDGRYKCLICWLPFLSINLCMSFGLHVLVFLLPAAKQHWCSALSSLSP